MFRFFCFPHSSKGCWVLISAASPVGRKREGKNICRIRLSDTKRARLHVLLSAVITLTHTVYTGTYLSQSYLVISFSVGKLICLIFEFVLFSRKAVTDDEKQIFLSPCKRLFFRLDFSPELWRMGGDHEKNSMTLKKICLLEHHKPSNTNASSVM